jgi:hypothetical protein
MLLRLIPPAVDDEPKEGDEAAFSQTKLKIRSPRLL